MFPVEEPSVAQRSPRSRGVKGPSRPLTRLLSPSPGFNQSECSSEPYFVCRNGKCIPLGLVCDDKGVDNCGDGSDLEENLTTGCRGQRHHTGSRLKSPLMADSIVSLFSWSALTPGSSASAGDPALPRRDSAHSGSSSYELQHTGQRPKSRVGNR